MEDNLREAERRIEEARRTGATKLDLGDLALSVLPESLGGLEELRELYLGTIGLDAEGESEWVGERKSPTFSDLSSLSGLQGLQSLNLIFCSSVSDLSPLSGLQGLQILNLAYCKGVWDLSSLSGLQGLQSLDLSGTGVSDLSSLSGLQGLQSLDLSWTGVWDLSSLSGLQGLQSLSLSGTGVSDLYSLSGLQGLQSLGLSETGVSDLSALSGLQGLQSLYLSNTSVSDLSPLSGLQRLQSLDLRLCRSVSDLSSLSGLKGLQSLNLSFSSSVSDLSSLSGLQGLQSLNLSWTGVSDLSPLSGLQGLQILDILQVGAAIPAHLVRTLAEHPRLTRLIANAATGVPREVLSRNSRDNCLPRLRAYLRELKLGAEPENEVKVILLGNGRVGKTQLCRRLRGEPYQDDSVSTHGVQLWRKPLTLKAGSEEQTFQVNWWDFGGQDIYHGTHALFLRSRAVFLILWTPHLENREEYEENGIPLRNQPLAYWLDYVRTLAGPGSAVIVVQSQCDRLSEIQPRQMETEGFGFLQSCYYSAKSEEEHGRENLEALLKGAIGYLLEQSGALQIGAGRFRVREELYRRHREDQAREAKDRQSRTLTLEEFQALCKEAGGIVSWEHALDYFHQTGVVFYDPNLFSNAIVLDQTWALDAIYAVFHRGQAAPWLRDSGRFTREDLALLVWQDRPIDEQKLFLGLMQSCGVCFPVGQTAKGETRFVAPDLLPPFETVRLPAWKGKPGLPTLRLEYRFFHQAVIRGLMREIGRRAADVAEYWKYGFWLQDGKRDTQILLQFEDTSSDQEPGAGALVVQAQGEDSLGLLREIRKAIRRQRIGEKPEEFLTLDGATVSREAVAGAIDGKVRDVEGKPAPAAPFHAFFSEEEGRFERGAGEPERPQLDIQPRPLQWSDKPRPEVYISYAWGDPSPEGKLRSQAVDGLDAALEQDGFAPIRDREAMKSGERISSFIRQLTHADLVVAVVSDKYLRSPFCLFEIYKLWQRSQAEPEVMGQCLVPVILPEVRIGSFRERAPYLRHWADEADALEPLVRDPKLRPSGVSWEEVRLVREFAHHVDDLLVFLNDVLMPRNLAENLDNGFEAVRDALRRRLAARAAGAPAAPTRQPS